MVELGGNGGACITEITHDKTRHAVIGDMLSGSASAISGKSRCLEVSDTTRMSK